MNLNEVLDAAKSVLDHNRIGCKSLLTLARFAAALLDETPATTVEIRDSRNRYCYDEFGFPCAPTRGQLAALRLAMGMEIE